MAYLKIPVRSDQPAYLFQIELEKSLYYLDFEWNERGQFWSMGIADQDQNPVVKGIRLVAGIPLTENYIVKGLPPGDFIIVDTLGLLQDPGVSDLGNRHLLQYRESTTVD